MFRAFGNRMLKQFVMAEPEIQDQEIDEEFGLVLLASDGLWHVVPNEESSLMLCHLHDGEEDPEVAVQKLTETAFSNSRGGADNITCIVVKFHHDEVDPADCEGD